MRYCCYLVGTSYFSLSYFSPVLCLKLAKIRLKHSLKGALYYAENLPCPQMMSCLTFLVVPPGLMHPSKIGTFHGLPFVRRSHPLALLTYGVLKTGHIDTTF